MKKIIRKACAFALAGMLALSGVFIGTGFMGMGVTVSADTSSIVLKQTLQNLLGSAMPYGIFANTTRINSDIDSNMATNELNVLYHTIGNKVPEFASTPGDIYIGSFAGVVQIKAANNLVLGSAHNAGYVTSGSKYKNLLYTNKYVNISGELGNINSRLQGYKTASVGVVTQYKDMNNYTIDTRGVSSQICVVDYDYSEYANIYKYAIGGLRILKNPEQTIIFNVKNMPRFGVVSINRFSVNGSSSYNNQASTDSLIWNFGTYNGTIYLSEAMGTFFAKNAEVYAANCGGRLIADSVCIDGGEWHFIDRTVEIPTTTATTAPTTTAPTTKPAETTTAPTTKPAETTTTPTTTPTTSQETTTNLPPAPPVETTKPGETEGDTDKIETTTGKTVETTVAETTKTTVSETTTKPGEVEGDSTVIETTTTAQTQTLPSTTATSTKAGEVEADKDTGDSINIDLFKALAAISGTFLVAGGIYFAIRRK